MSRVLWVTLILAIVGCNRSPSEAAGGLEQATDLFGGDRTADVVLRVLKARLKAQASLTDDQATLVTTSAANTITKGAPSAGLLDLNTQYFNDYTAFAGNMNVGGMLAFIDPALGIGKRSQINQILSTIVAHSFLEMRGNIKDINDPAFPAFITSLTHQTISALKSSGYQREDMDKAIETIMQSAVSNLSSAGILSPTNGAAVVAAVVRGAVMSLGDLGVTAVTSTGTATSAALLDSTATDTGTASGLPPGFPGAPSGAGLPAIVADNLPSVTFSGVAITPGNIGTFDPTQAFKAFDPSTLEIGSNDAPPQDVYSVSLYKLMQGTIPSLSNVGFTTQELLPVLKYSTFAMVSAMGDTGFDVYTVLSVMYNGIYGALDSVNSLNLDQNSLIEAIGQIAEGGMTAVTHINNFPADKANLIVESAIYILSSKITTIKGIDATTMTRAFEQIVASGTQGLALSGSDQATLAAHGAAIVATVLSSFTQIQNANTVANLAGQGDIPKQLCGAAIASGSNYKGFSGALKTAMGKNQKFLTLVPPGFDINSFWTDATSASQLLSQFAASAADPFASGGGVPSGFPTGGVIVVGGPAPASPASSPSPGGSTPAPAPDPGPGPAPAPGPSPGGGSSTFSIGGTLTSLSGGTLVLTDNGGNNLSLTASGPFTFTTEVQSAGTYDVEVLTQPTGQYCSVTSNTGTASANVTSVAVQCTAAKRMFLSNLTNGAFGSVAAADTLCGSDPNKPAGMSTWKAFLVDGVARVACTSANCGTGGLTENSDWTLQPSTTYIRASDSGLIGVTNANGIFSSLSGALCSYLSDPWTGLSQDWTSSGSYCSSMGSWKSNASSDLGTVGEGGVTTLEAISHATLNCAGLASLLCVEQ